MRGRKIFGISHENEKDTENKSGRYWDQYDPGQAGASQGFLLWKGSGPELPFEDNSKDAVIFFEVIEHIPENHIEELLQEFIRILRTGGIVVGSTPNYPVKRFYDLLHHTRGMFKRFCKKITVIFTENVQKNVQYPSARSKSQENSYSDRTNQKAKSLINSYTIKLMKTLTADDPTHQFYCDFSIINELGKKYFDEVTLYTTFYDKARLIGAGNILRLFSHKIGFVWSTPKKTQRP